jgi:poly-gamma-glutamate synthesis protein (capsule biosynthesis protein)
MGHGRFRGSALFVCCLSALLLAACTAEPDRPEPAQPEPGAPTVSSDPSASPKLPPSPQLVVVGHATLPQLELTAREAGRLTSGRVSRWRGFKVVHGAPARQAIRAVERDPGMLAVVPVDEVGPSVVAATVAGRDLVRDHPDAVDLTVTGDVMLVRGVPDADAALAPLRSRLRRADLTVGNLESTLSLRGEATQGDDSFGGTAALLRPLLDAGFDALSLANNHVGDYGTGALVDTVRELDGELVHGFGAGLGARGAAEPAFLEAGGTTFAFLGFNAIGETPAAGPGRPGALSVRMPPRTGPFVQADLDRVTAAVRRATEKADVVVVLPHWGTQYTHTPEPIQRAVSRQLVRAGADLVVGGHPHWVQGVDVVAGVPVVHSLGNFVFDMDFMEQTMEGVLLEATFWGDELKAVRFVPYRMDPDTFAPRPVGGSSSAGFLADLWGSSTGPFAD